MKQIFGLAAAASLILSGCAMTAPAYQMQTPFSDADFQPWAGYGNASLHGQAFLRTVGGEVRTCAGSKVAITPANAYGQELMRAEKEGFSDPTNFDSRAVKYMREATCDAQGNFRFSGIKSGGWIIETEVSWDIPSQGTLLFPQAGVQGGVMVQMLNLQPGDNEAILSDRDLVAH